MGVNSRGQNDIHRTKIKQYTVTLGQYIVVCPDKTMMVKTIFDIEKNVVNEGDKNQIVNLVP